MPKTAAPKRKLILITGIPGTGKTTYGNTFASQHGFEHYDLEVPDVFAQLLSDPERFIETLLQGEGNIVVTWGFLPDDSNRREDSEHKPAIGSRGIHSLV